MNVTSKISVDLTRQNVGQRVNAVQGDGNTREVEITLLAGGVPWTPPDGMEAAIAYMQPAGTKGMYNLLADGTAAISISGNVATVILAPQMLTASGTVQASLVFNDQQLNRLTTFPFSVSVTSNPAAGAQKVEDYLRLQWLEDKLDEYLKKYDGLTDDAIVRRIVDEYLTANPPTVTETDPTVPDWAKQPTKPTYTAAEVGALPDTYTPPNQTAQQVGADPAGTAASAVSQHNTDTTAHNDLRLALQGLHDRINAALDSDDTTLDQMSEVVAYIKSNKSLIDAITTSKVSVSDIVNDLVTNVADKPLSAAQGVALKKLIDDLQAMIPETYTLPIATETVLGGVKPVTATEAMTQPVGVDAEGRLMTKPGSGGSGISVTGATVGQTVKIAAVDDGGKPTAWEPVDLPNVGKWRKIADLTTSEDVKEIRISQDMNGKPFALKEVRIATCAGAVATGTGYDYCVMEVNGSSIVVGQNSGINTNRYYRYAYYSVATDGTGFGWFVSTNLSVGASSAFNSLSCMSGQPGLVEANHGFPITSVGFRHIAAAGLIAAGAEMVVYGIDA